MIQNLLATVNNMDLEHHKIMADQQKILAEMQKISVDKHKIMANQQKILVELQKISADHQEILSNQQAINEKLGQLDQQKTVGDQQTIVSNQHALVEKLGQLQPRVDILTAGGYEDASGEGDIRRGVEKRKRKKPIALKDYTDPTMKNKHKRVKCYRRLELDGLPDKSDIR